MPEKLSLGTPSIQYVFPKYILIPYKASVSNYELHLRSMWSVHGLIALVLMREGLDELFGFRSALGSNNDLQ